MHPFILVFLQLLFSVPRDQFQLILQDIAQMPLLLSPDLITLVILNCNCLLTYVTTLEFELKDKNHFLFTGIPVIPITDIQMSV